MPSPILTSRTIGFIYDMRPLPSLCCWLRKWSGLMAMPNKPKTKKAISHYSN